MGFEVTSESAELADGMVLLALLAGLLPSLGTPPLNYGAKNAHAPTSRAYSVLLCGLKFPFRFSTRPSERPS